MANIVLSVKRIDKNYQIQTSQYKYLVGEFIYHLILPYPNKELNLQQINILSAFNNAHHILEKNYKKVILNQISKNKFISLLKKAEIDEKDIKTIIKTFAQEEYLNEEKFCLHYLEKYQLDKGINIYKRFLEEQLIDKDTINKYINQFVENEDYIRRFIEKSIKGNKSSAKMLELKIKHNLYNKGFSKMVIDDIISEYTLSANLEQLKKDYIKAKNKYEDNYKVMSYLYSKGYEKKDLDKITRKEDFDE